MIVHCKIQIVSPAIVQVVYVNRDLGCAGSSIQGSTSGLHGLIYFFIKNVYE